MLFRRILFIKLFFLILLSAGVVFGQDEEKADDKKPEPSPTPFISQKDALKNPTAEMIAETSVFIYGNGGGRAKLDQIRRTTIERGKIRVKNAEGKMENASYQRWIIRGENSSKERTRLDQEFANAKYSMVYNDGKIFGIFNDSVFTPRDDVVRSYQNQIFYGLDMMLRYKENESKIELAGKEKVSGVDFHLMDVTEKSGRKARFYVSAKTFRIMIMDYEDEGVKYRRRYYDHNLAQGTLVPFSTVLYAGDSIVEETDIGTITFGQKVEESMFSES